MKSTNQPDILHRAIRFKIAVAISGNALLWLYMTTHPGVTGRIEVDAQKYFALGCAAAVVIWPIITVLRRGNYWQRLLTVPLLVLPVRCLFLVGEWAISHW